MREEKQGGIKTRHNSPVHLQRDDRDKPYLKKKQQRISLTASTMRFSGLGLWVSANRDLTKGFGVHLLKTKYSDKSGKKLPLAEKKKAVAQILQIYAIA